MRFCPIRVGVSIIVALAIFVSGYISANGIRTALFSVRLSEQVLEETSPDFEVFWEAWNRLQDSYYEGPQNVHDLVRGATRGMVDSVGDPHTVYVDPDIARLDRERLEGSFNGIGVTVDLDANGRLRIIRPLPGTPAERSGLRAGDVVISVNGIETRGRNLTDIIKQVRGPRGTSVILTIRRVGRAATIQLSVVRDKIIVPSVIPNTVNGYGYIRLTNFGDRTAKDLHNTLQDFRDENVRGVILDLRNNPGGFLGSAIDVASEFVPRNTVLVRERTRNEEERVFKSSKAPTLPDLPVAVLINGGSASASEIVAGVIRDYKRGVLIGETTFGKGSVQVPYSLSDESVVRVTVAIWLTPDGQHLDGEGISPDFALRFNGGELGTLDDNYIQAAIDVLEGKPCCANYDDAA
jgi:carboxyl-terminal processing protease